ARAHLGACAVLQDHRAAGGRGEDGFHPGASGNDAGAGGGDVGEGAVIWKWLLFQVDGIRAYAAFRAARYSHNGWRRLHIRALTANCCGALSARLVGARDISNWCGNWDWAADASDGCCWSNLPG